MRARRRLFLRPGDDEKEEYVDINYAITSFCHFEIGGLVQTIDWHWHRAISFFSIFQNVPDWR